MDNLRNILKKINIEGELLFNEPMSRHTTLKTGGPADIFITPVNSAELDVLLCFSREYDVPVFILGGGANLLVSDHGIRGIVIDTHNLSELEDIGNNRIRCGCGVSIDNAAHFALDNGLSGFDSFYGMPGSIGGAVWMNARCYGNSISDIIGSADYLDEQYCPCSINQNNMNFDYKNSIFQKKSWIITSAVFTLKPASKKQIENNMLRNKKDREDKGHYELPSAGSVFKNNRNFGKPSGMIIDALGLRGTQIGGAAISNRHANIFFNTGNASSSDIKELIDFVVRRVKDAYGFVLEPELQYIGEWK